MRSLARKQRIRMDVMCPEIDPKGIKASAKLRCLIAGEDWKDATIKCAWLLDVEAKSRAGAAIQEFDRLLVELGQRYRKSFGELRATRSVEIALERLVSKVQSQVIGLRERQKDKQWSVLVEFTIRAKTIH